MMRAMQITQTIAQTSVKISSAMFFIVRSYQYGLVGRKSLSRSRLRLT